MFEPGGARVADLIVVDMLGKLAASGYRLNGSCQSRCDAHHRARCTVPIAD
jgi:hypothetical protein